MKATILIVEIINSQICLPLDFIFFNIIECSSETYIQTMVLYILIIVFSLNIISINSDSILFISCNKPKLLSTINHLPRPNKIIIIVKNASLKLIFWLFLLYILLLLLLWDFFCFLLSF